MTAPTLQRWTVTYSIPGMMSMFPFEQNYFVELESTAREMFERDFPNAKIINVKKYTK